MKKVILLVMSLCFVIMCVSFASAEGSNNVLITFRGIEWGTPVGDISDKIPDGVKFFNPDLVSQLVSAKNFLYDGNNDYYKGPVAYSVSARSSSLKNMKVAGYEVSGMYMYFAIVPGADGLPTENVSDSALVMAYYKIEPKDPDAAYEDLCTKLTGLYGDADYSYEKSPYITYKYTVWYGSDGSAVSLVKEDYPSGSHYIYIKYAAANADEVLKKAYDALVLKESKEAASNVDGL